VNGYKIYSGAELDVNWAGGGGQGGQIGDTITNNGTLKLANTAAVTLCDTPTLYNYGTILVTSTGQTGLYVNTGDPYVDIQNSGTIQSTAKRYSFTDPVNMASASAKIEVDSGYLNFYGGDPNTGYSLTETQGTVIVDTASILNLTNGVSQSGGTTKTSGASGEADIWVGNKDYVMTGGSIIQVGDSSPSTPTLAISGNLQFTQGTVQLYYDTNGGVGSQLTATGNITIGQTMTTLAVTFIGNNLPNSFVAMKAGGLINRICQGNPTGYSASITNNNQNYTLTKNGSSPLLSLDVSVTSERPPVKASSELHSTDLLLSSPQMPDALNGLAGRELSGEVWTSGAVPWWFSPIDPASEVIRFDQWLFSPPVLSLDLGLS
jgi:hypothetical protein